MTLPDTQPASPRWGSTTKLIVGLTIVAIIAGLVVYFRTIIGPLILAFILAYLLHPVVDRMSTATRIPWRPAVNLIYLLFVIVMVGLITLSGLAIVQQVQSLVDFIQQNIGRVPEIITALSSQVFRIGPFEVDFKQFDFQALANQLLSSLQALVTRAGGLVGTVATSAAGTLGWLLFIMVISYFLLADTGQVSKELVHVDIPGYDQDLRHLSAEIRRIWNTFLRGQIIIILLVILTYTILMSALGMRLPSASHPAGIGRFVPYLGPLVLGSSFRWQHFSREQLFRMALLITPRWC
jgi:predicted PurR-regulated permease PerM